jgi:hypothetical protein
MFSYRATDERRLFARECQALQARLVSTLGTVSTMSLLHPDNQEWSEAVKKFGTVAAQLQHAANEVADLTEGKALFASHVFAPASHHFQQDALERLGIRPRYSVCMHDLQDIVAVLAFIDFCFPPPSPLRSPVAILSLSPCGSFKTFSIKRLRCSLLCLQPRPRQPRPFAKRRRKRKRPRCWRTAGSR